MSTTESPEQRPPKRMKYFSSLWAYPLALFVWMILSWAISLLTPRFGWQGNRPGICNWLGMLPVLIGTTGLIWGVAIHSAQSGQGIEWELDKSYFLRNGLYAYSRHPMYLAELILLFGWVIFFGSPALLVTFVAVVLLFNYYQVPLEERILEAHHGTDYREYKSRVPRWFGKIRH